MNRMYTLELLLSHSHASFGSTALNKMVTALSCGGSKAEGMGPTLGLLQVYMCISIIIKAHFKSHINTWYPHTSMCKPRLPFAIHMQLGIQLMSKTQLYLNFASGSSVAVEVAENLVDSFAAAGFGCSLP